MYSLDRELSVGDSVLCGIPGLASEMDDSWEVMYTVIEKLNKVNYLVEEVDVKNRKHIMQVKYVK